MKNSKLYDEITGRIVAAIEEGGLSEWIKPWTAIGLPSNAITRKAYRGINTLLLWIEAMQRGFASNIWMTFLQCQQAGGHILKGEKGVRIVFYRPVEKSTADGIDTVEENDEENIVRYLVIRFYTVFNLQQTDLEPNAFELKKKEFEPIAEARRVLEAYPVEVRHGGSRACYRPHDDLILLPIPEAFDSGGDYYACHFHEAIHSSGANSRLNRDLTGRFGDESYAAEELVAELGSAFLCAAIGIDGKLQHTEYISHWLKILKADNRAIFTAAAKAQAAVDYILSFSQVEDISESA